MNVLIVEDSKALAAGLKDGLGKLGYAVDAVGDGREGLDYARHKTYDVIVLDLMLPGLDGLSVLRALRAEGNEAHVLILSAKDHVDDRCAASGSVRTTTWPSRFPSTNSARASPASSAANTTGKIPFCGSATWK
jgi:CheY-like chemotaxis protein